MLLNVFSRFWPIYRNLFRMHYLARSVRTPTVQQVQEMLVLIEQTQTHAYRWPRVWSSEWYLQLLKSDSMLVQNLCFTSSLDGHHQDFIHDLLLVALRTSNTPLMEWLTIRLDATTLPEKIWQELQTTDPIVQCRFLWTRPRIDALTGSHRTPVLIMLAASEPHLWLYGYYLWYNKLSTQWSIVPPEHWWHKLHSFNLHSPPNAIRSIPYHYRGKIVTQLFPIKGSTAYSTTLLVHRRSTMLAPDPWAIVRSAFYGDTSLWSTRVVYLPETLTMYADALAILQQYYPHLLSTTFQKKVPNVIREATPSLEMLIFLGFSSGPEAHHEFSVWLTEHNGAIAHRKPIEVFALDDLL